jgi:hypothetical protein
MAITYKKRLILWCGLALLISLILNSLDIYAHYQAVSTNGSQEILWSVMYLAFLLLAIIFILIPLSLIGLIFKFSRKICIIILLCSIVYFGTAMTCQWFSWKLRMAAFNELTKRSEPLVQAIKTYETKYGNPPVSLENLVPEFFSNIPQTGMGAYPEYEYIVGDKAQKFAKTSWCLVVETPSGAGNWDIFMYFPSQDYPEHGYGGYLEKVGDWAYVHE